MKMNSLVMKTISPVSETELRALSDSELHSRTVEAAATERLATHRLLEHLREVHRRHVYVDFGYPNLHQYCIHALKLSEGSAYRRISALRLTEDVPEVESKIIDGSISLSVAAHAQSFFHKEGKLTGQKIAHEKKKEILESLEGLSLEDATRALLRVSALPEQHYDERLKPIGPELTELKLAITPEQRELFERVRGLIAHQHPSGQVSWSELFEKMARVALERLDPAREPKRRMKVEKQSTAPSDLKKNSQTKSQQESQPESKSESRFELPPELKTDTSPDAQTEIRRTVSPIGVKTESRVPSVSLKRQIWKRDQSKCRNCGSAYALEIDHIQDWAFGGTTSEDNLQLLCRGCHQRKTYKAHGDRTG